ncbi:hypothetical protein N9N67_11490 [Bacteriovoracaceae bacterium]|nr:hypothetical protein [Bacteriovoracaceae bacterium]
MSAEPLNNDNLDEAKEASLEAKLEVADVPFDFLRLLVPSEIENFTKRKTKQKVSALKAVSGEDVTGYEYRTYIDEVKSGIDGAKSPDDNDNSKAKILPFKKKKINSEELEKKRVAKELEEKEKEKKLILDEIEKLKEDEEKQVQKRGIVSSDLIKKKRQLEKKLSKLDEISETEFLLKQRRDLERSNIILKGQLAYDTYQKCAEIENQSEGTDPDADPDEEKSVGTTGVLLNKRQF